MFHHRQVDFMRSELLHIYGPIAINSYGLFIAIGVLLFVELVKRDPRFAQLGVADRFINIVIISGIVGLLGGRLLFMLTEPAPGEWYEILNFWNGGFSVLGGIVALLIFLPLYLRYNRISIFGFCDLVSIYAPLLLSISRVGCFFAGCCYGRPTDCLWGVCYTDQTSYAPLHVPLHPTQLYSAILLLGTFVLFYFVLRKLLQKPGQLFAAFLFFHGAERFIVDFWRDDRLMVSWLPLSIYQLIALGLVITGALGFYTASTSSSKTQPSV